MVFIDTESKGNASSVQILEEADIVVVNIDQEQAAWDDFFEHFEGLASKSIFLVGQYEKENPFDQEQLRKEYRIPKERIGAVPYNIDLRMAAAEGRIIPFLNRNYLRSSRAENSEFMSQLKQAAVMLKENIVRTGKQDVASRYRADERRRHGQTSSVLEKRSGV